MKTKPVVIAALEGRHQFRPLSFVFASILLLSALGAFVPAYGDTIFTENFNAMAEQDLDGRCRFEGDSGCNSVPGGWDFMFTSDANPSTPPGRILGGAGRTGNGLRVYDESYGDRNSWGHDFQLAKHFAPSQYRELWVSLWIRFNPALNRNDLNSAKIFRMGHYNPRVIDGTTNTNVFNTNANTSEGPTTSGLMFYDIKAVSDAHFRHKISLRGDPSYKMGNQWNGPQFEILDRGGELVDKSWEATYGDGEWHLYEVGMIMNSSPGVQDGRVLVYLDGVYQGGEDNVPWLQAGHDIDVTGFNMFTLGGNADFVWDGQSNAEQYFYDIDDVMVCTTRCTELPKTPTENRVE